MVLLKKRQDPLLQPHSKCLWILDRTYHDTQKSGKQWSPRKQMSTDRRLGHRIRYVQGCYFHLICHRKQSENSGKNIGKKKSRFCNLDYSGSSSEVCLAASAVTTAKGAKSSGGSTGMKEFRKSCLEKISVPDLQFIGCWHFRQYELLSPCHSLYFKIIVSKRFYYLISFLFANLHIV